jgi:serine/threonine-protein phosphatase 4 regulatory subunit 1
MIGVAARYAVVNLLARMRRADIREGLITPTPSLTLAHGAQGQELEMDRNAREWDERDVKLGLGLFGHVERRLFTHEILYQIVIGIGSFDIDEFDRVFGGDYWGEGDWDVSGVETSEALSNQSPPQPTQPPGAMFTLETGSDDNHMDVEEGVEEWDDKDNYSDFEESAVRRLSSMSLMAAVTASGTFCQS